MALAEFSHGAACRVGSAVRTSLPRSAALMRRSASSTSQQTASAAAQGDINDLETSSSLQAPAESYPSFDPVAQTNARKEQLPSSRYQFRPPRYYRGPLHPHQPPPSSDPASREFVPGPFTMPRATQTYQTTIAPDLMTLTYQHFPPGYEAPVKGPRLRTWDDSSPYHKGRGVRPPRGGDSLRPVRTPITFRNIPRLDSITVHSFVQAATKESAPLHVAGMALQAITGVQATPHQARKSVVTWGLRKGKHVSVTTELRGEYMYHFMGKLVDVVMPRLRDWKGMRTTSGDGTGNFNFGLTPEEVSIFPEIEVNYDFYPPKMIPGCHINIKTTAKSDRDAKLLLTSLGVPFDM